MAAELEVIQLSPVEEIKMSLADSAAVVPLDARSEEKALIRDLRTERANHVLEWNMAEIAVNLPGGRFDFLKSKDAKRPARQKVIIRNVVGRTMSGELTAVMGPSGAGKTTLVECLSMRSRNFTGAIHLDGKSPGGDYFTTSALVHQRELLFGFLTAREHLIFHAMARMSQGYSRKEIYDRVDEVLAGMNLTKSAHTQIGGTDPIFFKKGLSGGERKRLTVATELLLSPSIIFLDEPTSGLDSVMAESVVHTLRSVADNGAIVLCSIHGPSSNMAKVFTHLILLTCDGRLAYHGPFQGTSQFFSSLGHPVPRAYNPSDFYLRVVSPIPGISKEDNAKRLDMIVEGYKRSPLALTNPPAPSDDHKEFHAVRGLKASNWTLLKLNVWRGLLQTFRDMISTGLWGVVQLTIGCIFGILFWQQASDSWRTMIGMCFSVIVAIVFTASVAVIVRFPMEWSVVVREYYAGANAMGPYVIAKYIYDFPNSYAPVLLSTALYWMTGLDPSFLEYAKFTGVMVLVSNTAVGLAMMVSSLSSNPSVAIATLPVFLAPMILFSGLLYQKSTIPVYLCWLQPISLVNYGFSAILSLQIHQLPKQSQEIVKTFVEIDPTQVKFDIGMIAVMLFLFYFITYINLRLRLRSTRDG